MLFLIPRNFGSNLQQFRTTSTSNFHPSMIKMTSVTRIERRVSDNSLEERQALTVRSKSGTTTLANKVGGSLRLSENPPVPSSFNGDGFNDKEFQRKLHLLKCRYKHAIKSELVSFCYACNDAGGDTGLVDRPTKSPEFVQTLMKIVEKDKDIADLAVNLVEEIDIMEKVKLHEVDRQRNDGDLNKVEDSLFKKIWDNHESSRKHVAKLLEDERIQIYGEKDVSKNINLISQTHADQDENPPAWTKVDSFLKFQNNSQQDCNDFNAERSKMTAFERAGNPGGECELREVAIADGLNTLLERLGCNSSDCVSQSASNEEKLVLIQERLKKLKDQVEQLRRLPNARQEASLRSTIDGMAAVIPTDVQESL